MEYKFENDILFNSKMEIVGYENYLIYPDGKVYSKHSKRYLKCSSREDGRKHYVLCSNGKRKTHTIHRLVAKHYIPNPENKREVDHINRDTTDNRLDNLRWVTRSENQQNKGKSKNNTSGHKNITYTHYKKKKWMFHKKYLKKSYQKYFISIKEALCFKFVFLLKIKCNII